MSHTKRINAPNFWKTGKKTSYWVVSPKPGPHPKSASIPLLVLVRDVLGLAKTAREARAIIKGNQVKVDGKIRREHNYSVGLMDVVQAGNQFYRIMPYRNGLMPVKIPEGEVRKKVLKITGKKTVRKGKIQITFHDSRTMLLEVEAGRKINTGESVLFDVGEKKILEIIPLENKTTVVIYDGTHKGKVAQVLLVQKNKNSPDTVILEGEKKNFETLKDYVIAVGKDGKTVISMEAN